jgi:hypothetical protein
MVFAGGAECAELFRDSRMFAIDLLVMEGRDGKVEDLAGRIEVAFSLWKALFGTRERIREAKTELDKVDGGVVLKQCHGKWVKKLHWMQSSEAIQDRKRKKNSIGK